MTRQRIYNTDAVVLRARLLGEADRLLTLFTPGLGKLQATVRGARKPTSKLGGHLDPLTCSSVTLAKGRGLDTITGADTKEPFINVKNDLSRLSAAIYLAELIDAFNPLESPNHAAYALFLEGLRALGTSVDIDLSLRYLEIQLLGSVGFLPELQQCVDCRGEITPKAHFFGPAGGGVLCPGCRQSHSDAMPLSLGALKVLRFFSATTMHEAILVKVKSQLRGELSVLLGTLLRYTLERELRSTTFVRSVSRLRPSA